MSPSKPSYDDLGFKPYDDLGFVLAEAKPQAKTAGTGKTGPRLKGEPQPPAGIQVLSKAVPEDWSQWAGDVGDPDVPVAQRGRAMAGVLGSAVAPGMLGQLGKQGMDSVGPLRSPVTRGAAYLAPQRSIGKELASEALDFLPIPGKITKPVQRILKGPQEPEMVPHKGKLEFQSPFESPTKAPVWSGMPPPSPRTSPEVSPIVPPPRTPRNPPPASRTPIWKDSPPPEPRRTPEFSPVPAEKLPSGRIPGKTDQGIQSVPFEPVESSAGRLGKSISDSISIERPKGLDPEYLTGAPETALQIAQARAGKVQKINEHLASKGVSKGDLLTWSDQQWKALAKEAGFSKGLSPETRKHILRTFGAGQ